MTEQIDPWLAQFHQRRDDRKNASRTIVFCGEKLTYKAAIAPQVAIDFNDTRNRAIRGWAAAAAATEANPSTVEVVSDAELIDAADAAAMACLEPGSVAVWQKLRDAGSEFPLTFAEVFQFTDFIIAKCSTHPTDAPSGSSNGRASGGRSSRAGSSSKVAARKR